jgi:ceramide glucosyltransferase
MSPWDPIVIALSALAALGLAVSSVSRLLVCSVVRHRPKDSASRDRVDILKPLCGVDASLAENLSAFSRQSHPLYGIIFGVASANDEALGVAQRFCREHPELATQIRIGETTGIYNPKVALLAHMTRGSTADWVVVSDSNVRVTEDYVRDALSHAGPDVGLVTHLVRGAGGTSPAAHLESLQLGCFVAPGVCGARYVLGETCVIGKSMFLRREALERIGGFEAVGGYLAEDYVIGRAIADAGYRVVTPAMPVATWNEGWTIGKFASRHLRWAVMRRQVSRAAYLIELLLTPGPLLMLVLLIGGCVPTVDVDARWVAACLVLDQVLDVVTLGRMSGRLRPWPTLLLNPLRQWLTLAIWALGWFVQTVEWRGKSYRVGVGSRLEPLRSAASTPTRSLP